MLHHAYAVITNPEVTEFMAKTPHVFILNTKEKVLCEEE